MNWLTKDWASLVAQKISKTYKQLMKFYTKQNKTKQKQLMPEDRIGGRQLGGLGLTHTRRCF